MPNQWFRLYYDFATDPKVQIMPEKMQRRLVMLFCCQRDAPVTFCDEDMAFHWNVTVEDLEETKALFLKKGFIDEQWNLVNWNKRQYISDSSTERTRQYRERLRTSQERPRDVTVTAPDTDTDSETKQKQTKKKAAQAPLVVPDWMPKEPWEGWLEMRTKKKTPNTNRALGEAINKLLALRGSHNLTEVLDNMTLKGWTGVYPPSSTRNGLFGQQEPRRIQSTPLDRGGRP